MEGFGTRVTSQIFNQMESISSKNIGLALFVIRVLIDLMVEKGINQTVLPILSSVSKRRVQSP